MSSRLTTEDRVLRAVTEQQWQSRVTNLADFHQWRWWHAPDNRPITARSGRLYVQPVRAGFPDLVLSRGPRLVFAELKRELGRVSPEQSEWLAALAATGAETYLWRPSDWADVQATLRGPA